MKYAFFKCLSLLCLRFRKPFLKYFFNILVVHVDYMCSGIRRGKGHRSVPTVHIHVVPHELKA